MSKLERTMRVDFVKNRELANVLALRMEDKKPFTLDNKSWLITKFRPIESTNYVTIYMEEA